MCECVSAEWVSGVSKRGGESREWTESQFWGLESKVLSSEWSESDDDGFYRRFLKKRWSCNVTDVFRRETFTLFWTILINCFSLIHFIWLFIRNCQRRQVTWRVIRPTHFLPFLCVCVWLVTISAGFSDSCRLSPSLLWWMNHLNSFFINKSHRQWLMCHCVFLLSFSC